MFNYYMVNAIPVILNNFDVKKIVISGLSDNETVNYIVDYCDKTDAEYISIDAQSNFTDDIINDYTLNVLPKLSNFDAIFINDDPNWYSVYNELKIIMNNNNKFPLVFVCHNIFPHKRRDSYINPNVIPKEFVHENSKELDFEGISIHGRFYHAINENTPKNGVLTAIEDFLSENSSIKLMDFKLLNGIVILYSENLIDYNSLHNLKKELSDYLLDMTDLSDIIIKHELTKDDSNKLAFHEMGVNSVKDSEKKILEQEKIISEYENKIQIYGKELEYKDSKIDNFESKLNLKEAQVKNIESKLFNRQTEINNLNIQINSLKSLIGRKENDFKNKEKEFNHLIDSLKSNISERELTEMEHHKNEMQSLNDDGLSSKNGNVMDNSSELNSIKRSYLNNLSKLTNNEYCIKCYKEKISNNNLEIQYLKEHTVSKKFSSPLEYLYLIFKSNPSELIINFKLYKALKNSKCFDIGYYLSNNKDLQNSNWCKFFSLELHYVINGFTEERKFNKKYFNRNSKIELLDYILNCNY